jgi:lactoylglutathione lyase
VLYVPDLARSRRFYEQLGLKFELEKHGQGPEHLSSRLGDVVLELYPCGKEAPGRVRLGFQVDSVDRVVAELQSAGVMPVRPPQPSPWGRRAVIRDPDGNTVELTSAN